MSAAEALPPVSPWRDTSHLDHIPTDADMAAAPPPNEAGRAVHDANVARLVTQAVWQPRAADEPFTVREMVLDRLDEAEDIFETLVEIAQETEQTERLIDWPDTEPDRWR